MYYYNNKEPNIKDNYYLIYSNIINIFSEKYFYSENKSDSYKIYSINMFYRTYRK